MQKIREILRLGFVDSLSRRQIAKSCGVSRPAVGDYLDRAQALGLTLLDLERMSDSELERTLKRDESLIQPTGRPQPDCAWIHGELKKKSVTLRLLWEEYKEIHPDGYQLSQFCEYYKRWKCKLDLSMRQSYKAGEKMFVDYAGQTIPITDRDTGEEREAQIFVAVLGASNYSYSEASWDQSLESWINSHVRTFEYFQGVAGITTPDNLKSGVSKPCRYEPDINPTYLELAVHYGTAIIPARVGKPRDKAKVESGVLIVERWILAALRNRTFFSLAELNQAIKELLVKLNERPFNKLDGSRKSWFETIERPALKALPDERYVFAQWKGATVNIDYHIDVEGHYYSAPHRLSGQKVMARYTATTVEIFHDNKRVTSHRRDDRRGRHSTQPEHMPKSHQQYLEWSPSRIIRWAGTVGECTQKVVEEILSSRPHPEQGYRSSLGVLRLGKRYGEDRLERACKRAIVIGSCRYKSICSILEKGLDQEPLATQESNGGPIKHRNIRGGSYYA